MKKTSYISEDGAVGAEGEGEMNNTFEANGKTWVTDDQTISLMREYRDTGNDYMVAVVFSLGRDFGRVKEQEQ